MSAQLDFRDFCNMCVTIKRQNVSMCQLSEDGTLHLRRIPQLSTKYSLPHRKQLVFCVGTMGMCSNRHLILKLARLQTKTHCPQLSCKLRLCLYVMGNSNFPSIVSTQRYSFCSTDGHEEGNKYFPSCFTDDKITACKEN